MSGVNGEQPKGTFSFSLNRIFCCNSQRIYEPRVKRKREEKPREDPTPEETSEESSGSISIELVE